MLTAAISILKTTTQYNNSSSSSDKLYNISDDSVFKGLRVIVIWYNKYREGYKCDEQADLHQ